MVELQALCAFLPVDWVRFKLRSIAASLGLACASPSARCCSPVHAACTQMRSALIFASVRLVQSPLPPAMSMAHIETTLGGSSHSSAAFGRMEYASAAEQRAYHASTRASSAIDTTKLFQTVAPPQRFASPILPEHDRAIVTVLKDIEPSLSQSQPPSAFASVASAPVMCPRDFDALWCVCVWFWSLLSFWNARQPSLEPP